MFKVIGGGNWVVNKREAAKPVGTEAGLSKWAALTPQQRSAAARRACTGQLESESQNGNPSLLLPRMRWRLSPNSPCLKLFLPYTSRPT